MPGGARPTLNLIGAGRVGRTLAGLWQRAGAASLQQVLTRSPHSAAAAVDAVGAGAPAASPEALRPADLWLLAVPDTAIAAVATQLARLNLPPSKAVHCSGFLPAAQLQALTDQGWSCASAHPALSFADPQQAAQQFAGTVCALEGDPAACRIARELLEAVGGRCFELSAVDKPLYHGAAVFASNFMPVLQAVAAELWQGCGMPPELVEPLWRGFVRQVSDNLLALGPAAALTGPAARGDLAVVAAQAAAMQSRDPVLGQAYASLSELAARLAREGHSLR